ncbi:MAG TPA: cobalt ECF transporter T component CbiQ, partial [Phycisphaerae bacterium]|nr:cobalt ECF transporter T component CbiQ [Phycisphaerae bacterium]
VPAWLKFFIAIGIVIATALCPPHRAPRLRIPAALLLILLPISRLPLLPLLKRLLLLEPFVLGVALLALFSPGTPHDRALHFAFLVARCTISLLALLLFTATTPFADLLKLFQQLRVPALLVTTLALMHRYLFVLAEESARMRRARQSRTFTPRRRLHWQTLSSIIAQLFLRATDRADHIYNAMRSRGWNAGE